MEPQSRGLEPISRTSKGSLSPFILFNYHNDINNKKSPTKGRREKREEIEQKVRDKLEDEEKKDLPMSEENNHNSSK